MNKTHSRGFLSVSLAALLAGFVCVPSVHAHPYASGVSNNAGTISFILNEPATSYTVVFDNGTSPTSPAMSPAQGIQSFALGAHTNYSIIVSNIGLGIPSQISVDSNNYVNFNSPRGVVVNQRGSSPYFGRVYVANSAAGNAGNGRPVGDGMYMLNADLSDALGLSNTVSGAGINWTIGGSSAPFQMALGPDDNLYVTDESLAGANIWQIDPNVMTGTNVFAGLGSTDTGGNTNGVHGRTVGCPVVLGSLLTSNLVVYGIDADLPTTYSIFEWEIGAGPLPWTNPPTAELGSAGIGGFVSSSLITADLQLGPNGYFYTSEDRGSSTDGNDGVKVYDTTGTNLLFGSSTVSGDNDPYVTTAFNAVSPDGQFLATLLINSAFTLTRLTNGVPDLSTLTTNNFPPLVSNGRGLTWDAADNLYASSSGQGLLRVYSLGLTTTAITHNDATGTNGTFQFITPSTSVSVVTTTSQASQSGPVAGVFTITRTGTDLSDPLTVNFTLTGTAANGVAYTSSATNSVVIPGGQTTTTVTITPVADGVSRPSTTAILTLKGGATYTTTTPSFDTVYIQNTGPQELVITGVGAASMYKGITNDFASIIVSRWGDTNDGGNSYTVSNFTYAGTAVLGTDFTPAQPVTFNPGDVSKEITVSPLDTVTNYVGNQTVIVGLGSGGGVYMVGTNTATVTLIDNADPATMVLFADPLTNSLDGTGSDGVTKWKVTYANADMANIAADDYEVDFGYSLSTGNPSTSTNGVLGLPPNGATNALRITCNKDYFPGATAGVNVYPANLNLSGNFAVRFSLNLVQGDSLDVATEGVLFGINHTGTDTNWWAGDGIVSYGSYSNWASDGIWYWVCSDEGGAGDGDYIEFTGLGGTNGNPGWQFLQSGVFGVPTYTNLFKNPVPYTTTSTVAGANDAGIPANASSLTTSSNSANTWSDVEIKQINNVVTMSINKTPIFTYLNTTVWTNGTLMLGYNDPFASVGAPDGAAYFSNLRAVQLGPPSIIGVALIGGNVVIKFATTDGDDNTSSFTLLGSGADSAAVVNTSVPATFTQMAAGVFEAVTPVPTNSAQFYRLKHN